MQETGERIKEIRKQQNMTLQDVCDICGITKMAVCKWQKGISLPTIDNLVILASVWGMKVDDIIVTQTD